jgi:predicted ATP-dependent serine protease
MLFNSFLCNFLPKCLEIPIIPKRISETFIKNYTEEAVIIEPSKKDLLGFGDLLPPLPNTKTAQENKSVSKGSKIMNLEDFKNLHFKTLDFSIHSEYYSLFGSPAENFKLMIYGKSGHGKSTFSVEFAEFLALNFGRVLYNSSEEGLSKSLQKKVQGIETDLFDLAFCKSAKELLHELSQPHIKTPRFLFIDSINHMKITIEELQDIINLDKNRSIIWLMQTTKTGAFRGDNEFAHESDMILKFENYTPIVDKTRFK